MRVTFVVIFVLSLLAIVFALQNPAVIELRFGPWAGNATIAATIMATFAVGLLTGLLAMVPSRMRRNKEIRNLKRTVGDRETSMAESKEGTGAVTARDQSHAAGE